ncbi:MAG TPA: ACT domain-containing protein [Anaeromyxobacter sp.]|nr:ACT domain-containing protein [Anaeromyxobacter sp.]
MARAKELKIRVENRPGMLGEVASALAQRKVNIRGINAWVENDEGVIRLVVDLLPAARKALAKQGWKAEEADVLELELPDKVGALAKVTSALGAAGVDITHVFVGTAGARKATVFLGVSDLKTASTIAARALR